MDCWRTKAAAYRSNCSCRTFETLKYAYSEINSRQCLLLRSSEGTLTYLGARGALPSTYVLMPKCILIVDDSPVIRRALRSLVQCQPGFEVCGEAADGVEAIEKAVELKPDLIILDFSMPRMNGLEAAAALQKIMPTVPIILFTFHKEAVSGRQVLDAGIASVVSKTDQMGSLPGEMRRLAGAA